MKRAFRVRACWDGDAKVFYAESDIDGLNIETPTLEEFENLLLAVAPELILSNHFTADELAKTPLEDLVPVILWRTPHEAIERNGRNEPSQTPASEPRRIAPERKRPSRS